MFQTKQSLIVQTNTLLHWIITVFYTHISHLKIVRKKLWNLGILYFELPLWPNNSLLRMTSKFFFSFLAYVRHDIILCLSNLLFFVNIVKSLRTDYEVWLSVILNCHFDLLNAIFMRAGIPFQTQHTLILKKRCLTNNYLLLKAFYLT